jgi:hypothetical protein
VLIKPDAARPDRYPATTSRESLELVIAGIRRVSDADIIILAGDPEGRPMQPTYQALGYDFPRVLILDVRDSVWIEVESPLTKPFALPSVWVPNVILSCDYWISMAPFKVVGEIGHFSIRNLLGLLPATKYPRGELEALGLDRVVADLYFTLPFDLGIVDGRQLLRAEDGRERVEEYGKVFVGEPFEVDWEASEAVGARSDYLGLIDSARAEFDA